MDIEEIKNILTEGRLIIFGPGEQEIVKKGDYRGLPYLEADLNSKTLRFTSDTMDYMMQEKLEEVLECLFKEFGITSYTIQIHIHKGEHHDKDIIVNLQKVEEFPEIIKFIQERFYKALAWNFAATE